MTRSNDLRNAKTRRTRVFAAGPGGRGGAALPGQSPMSGDLGEIEEEPETPRTGQTDDWIASLSGIEELQFSISFCQFLETFNFSKKKRATEGVIS